MNTHFTVIQLTTLFIGVLFLVAATVAFLREKSKLSVYLLASGAIGVFLFAAQLDPFLNLWDERFHALVAKNMMNDPFNPMLYREKLFNLDYLHWASAHIWLHKQPLFMWQMAISFKLFGLNELSLRIPSVILSTLTALAIFRTGKLLVNRNTGFIASLLFISSYYIIELISGRQILDQNDISFLAYVSLSIWSWVEYKESGKWKWLILIGVFSGAAMLCKWFVGLLVYLGWGVENFTSRPNWRRFIPMLLSLSITALVFLPWQWYTFSKYPTEAQAEWMYNSLHFSVSVEGHEGPWWFHLSRIGELFGMWIFVLLPVGFLLFNKFRNKPICFGLLAMILGVELFFALAQTKMPSFTIVLALPIFIFSAVPLSFVLTWLHQKLQLRVLIPVVSIFLIIMVFIRIDVDQLRENHTSWKTENVYPVWMHRIRNTFISLQPQLNSNAVVYNVYGRHYIELMFYTDALATNYIPTSKEVEQMFDKGKEVFIFVNDRSDLPNYLLDNEKVKKLKIKIQGYE